MSGPPVEDELQRLQLGGASGGYPPPAAPGQYGNIPAASGSASGGLYPAVPGTTGAPPQTYPGMYSSSNSGAPPVAVVASDTASSGAGWSNPGSIQPAHANAAGQFGHYGQLQFAPSFNTVSGTAAVAASPAGPPADASAAASGPAAPQAVIDPNAWVLGEKLPQLPANQIVGPMVRLTDFDPVTGTYALSMLVVAHPSLTNSTVQMHYAVNAPATQSAPSQILDEYMGYRFYRFDVSLVLADAPGTFNYLIGLVGGEAPLTAHTIILPARGEPWRFVAYSCNGFHEDEPEEKYGGIAYLWNDLLQRHGEMRYHLQVGGGDQIYCDRIFNLPSLKPWLSVDEPHVRSKEPFTPVMLQEVEQYYFGHYMHHFADPPFAAALAQIPFVFSWDDHDIFDGWGSYPEYLQQSAVFQGMFAVARRFYLLFQQHCRYDNAHTISKTMGDFCYHQVRNVGNDVLLLAPDTRSQRSIHQVVTPAGWDQMFDEVNKRLAAAQGSVRHLLVLLPVPIVYPRIPVSEGMLASMSGAMAQSKAMRDAIGSLNLPSSAVSAFNEPDLLDDLLDHWTSNDHQQERQMLVRRLQAVAQTYNVRVTFISGDVHVGAFGCFQAHPKQLLRACDPKFMLQVVSSAIGNEPPPAAVITVLETSSMASTAMGDTLDKMIKAFSGNHKLKGARNYCEVVHVPGTCACHATGAPLPPGALSFTLRIEQGPPGQPTGIETCSMVSPPLLCGPAAEGYAAQNSHIQEKKVGGMVGMVSSILPEATGKQLQAGVKTMGHRIANFLNRV